MAQRDVLLQAINLLNTLRGPAKIYFATSAAPMPSNIYQAINATTGAPVSPWIAFGLTRGGINVSKNEEVTVRDDVDQIYGAYDQDTQGIDYMLSTQLAEILDRTQAGMAMDMGVPTVVVATAGLPTQVMVPMDSGSSKPPEWRWLVVYPKPTVGKLIAFAFRRGAVAGGEKVMRFDKSDPASPPLEIRMFPEISTAITADDAVARRYDID